MIAKNFFIVLNLSKSSRLLERDLHPSFHFPLVHCWDLSFCGYFFDDESELDFFFVENSGDLISWRGDV